MPTSNICILAHVDAGKTSLTEQLLFAAGVTRKAGSVDNGTSATDRMLVERRRGISVRNACATATHNGRELCFIDTPGHVDFSGEVERSLSVPDGAVLVISAVEGIQAQTRLVAKALKKIAVPTVIVINKIDRAGADYAGVLAALPQALGLHGVLMQTVAQQGSEACRVSPRSKEELAEDILLASEDDALMDSFLNGALSPRDVFDSFTDACQKAKLYPVFCTSAKAGVGIEALLDALTRFLPDASVNDTGVLSGKIFKVEHDRDMGKAAYVRLFGGELHSRDTVILNGEAECKIAQIRRFDGVRTVDCGALKAGETGILYGLSAAKNGDTVGAPCPREQSHMAVPLLTVTVKGEKEEEQATLMDVLTQLSDEDPLLQFAYNQETREMCLNITGMIELEVLEELIYERCGCRAYFSDPSVIFKETPRIPAVGYESYTMPKPCWAQVELKIEPLPRGSGIVFESAIKDNIIPYRYQHHVALSVTRDCVKQGIYGWEVTDARITLTGGAHHNIHTHPLDFFVATPIAFLRALTASEAVLLEPYIRVTLSAEEHLLGKVIGHIIDMRGSFGDPVIENGAFLLEATLPVQTSLDYAVRFRSLTGGKGTFASEFDSYRECPKEEYHTLPRRTPDPLDKPRWILYCRNCMRDPD